VDLFSELMNSLANIDDFGANHRDRIRPPVPSAPDEIEDAVLIHSIASTFNLATEDKRGMSEDRGMSENGWTLRRFERLPVLLHFALAERHSARVPRAGFLNRIVEVAENRRYSMNKSKIMRN
jgi:hypothetical protein